MKPCIVVLAAFVVALGCASQAPAQTQRLSIKDLQTIQRRAHQGMMAAIECHKRQDCACVEARLKEALRDLEHLPPQYRAEKDFAAMFWEVYTRLALVADAKRIYNSVSPDLQDEWLEQYNKLNSDYGTIQIETDDRVREDPTLAVADVQITPLPGTPSTCPYSFVNVRAAEIIRRAFESREFVTEPIALPAGKHRLKVVLTRESGLNYGKPILEMDIQVTADAVQPVKIDPERSGLPWKLLAAAGALILTPFFLVN